MALDIWPSGQDTLPTPTFSLGAFRLLSEPLLACGLCTLQHVQRALQLVRQALVMGILSGLVSVYTVWSSLVYTVWNILSGQV